MSALTPEDYGTLVYYHREKGDITGCTTWEKKLPEIRAAHPELVDAVERLRSAERTLDAVVKSLPENW